jgi:hypothetical protein
MFLQSYVKGVRFEVFMAVTMKKAVFWDVTLCRYCVKRRLGFGISLSALTHAGSSLADFLLSSTLKTEAIRSSETSVNTISTRGHIPEDSFLLTCKVFKNAFTDRPRVFRKEHQIILNFY